MEELEFLHVLFIAIVIL